jgi:hypothetical protein
MIRLLLGRSISFFDYLKVFAGILSNVMFPHILVIVIELVLAAYIIKAHREQTSTEEDFQYDISEGESEPLT